MNFYQFILALNGWQFFGVVVLAALVVSAIAVFTKGIGRFRIFQINHYHDGKKGEEK